MVTSILMKPFPYLKLKSFSSTDVAIDFFVGLFMVEHIKFLKVKWYRHSKTRSSHLKISPENISSSSYLQVIFGFVLCFSGFMPKLCMGEFEFQWHLTRFQRQLQQERTCEYAKIVFMESTARTKISLRNQGTLLKLFWGFKFLLVRATATNDNLT